MQLYRFLVFGLIMMISLVSFSQNTEVYVRGQALIQLEKKGSMEEVLKNWPYPQSPILDAELISPPLSIYLISFDESLTSMKRMLSMLYKQPGIAVAQVNHKIESRDLPISPDDPLLGNQWQWINTGAGGGTADADVDADLAWDITTGGLTPNGDTIVVCVVEGSNRNHPDLRANNFFNHGEIPGNGIDDDGNGYIDDYNGWNTSSLNDNIPPDGHGTSVSGMIGAVGNNGLGVTGINWNIKIMHVEFGGLNEANVISAYTYPLVMRRLYNETNGQKGAFVVATNSSWGLDNQLASSAPLWCAFYDELGKEGILSCGATANNAVNVDVVGDLPTSCASEFLVSVTATNNQDIRTFSGYGLTTIDVGAPGGSIYTTNGTAYGSTSGTSFASPLVAGLIGLMYSGPCSNIGDLARTDPETAARLVRDAIYTTVDTVGNLLGQTVTGGRVNAHKALLALTQACSNCPPPSQIQFTDRTDSTTLVSWVAIDPSAVFDAYLRPVGSMVWDTTLAVSSPYLLKDLEGCTGYELLFKSTCGDSIDFSAVIVFETEGCCVSPNPTSLTVQSDLTQIALTWNSIYAAQAYAVHYKQQGTGMTISDTTLVPNYVMTGLDTCTMYDIQISTLCTNGETAPDPIELTARTSGCGACLELAYCPSNATDATGEWIANVTFAGINNTSVSNNGYINFGADAVAEVNQFTTYPISLTPGYATLAFPEFFTVYLDKNQNGVFSNNEIVYQSTPGTTSTINGQITIGGDVMPGLTRMRVMMRWNVTPGEGCNNSYEFGEVEDYCVMVNESTPPACPAPSSTTATNPTFTGATLTWTSTGNAQTYAYFYQPFPTGTAQFGTATTNTVPLTGLLNCKDYIFAVRPICSGFEGSYGDTIQFTTACYPPCDQVPSDIATDSITQTDIYLTWTGTDNATNYSLRFRKLGTTIWSPINNITSPLRRISNLTPCTEYQVEVRANCLGNLTSTWSPTEVIKTKCVSSTNEPTVDAWISVFPNPFTDQLKMVWRGQNGIETDLQLWDITGRQVASAKYTLTSNKDVSLQGLADLPQGIYFLHVKNKMGHSIVKVQKL